MIYMWTRDKRDLTIYVCISKNYVAHFDWNVLDFTKIVYQKLVAEQKENIYDKIRICGAPGVPLCGNPTIHIIVGNMANLWHVT